jgi:hypothetical protein
MRVSSSLIAYTHENQICTSSSIRVFSTHVKVWPQIIWRVAWEHASDILYPFRVHFMGHIAWSNENKSCMRVDKSMRTARVTWERFRELSKLGKKIITKLAWNLASESLQELLVVQSDENTNCMQAKVCKIGYFTVMACSNENKNEKQWEYNSVFFYISSVRDVVLQDWMLQWLAQSKNISQPLTQCSIFRREKQPWIYNRLGYSKISRISAKVSLPLLSKSTSGEYSSMDEFCWTCR